MANLNCSVFPQVDPNLSNAPWTEEEDKKIVAAQSKFGNRFAEIAKYFQGRSESVVSHRWHLVLQWRKEEILKSLDEVTSCLGGVNSV